jgi:cell division protease FtsH
MDGFSSLDKVVIVAATNRIDLVDYAILRAGRFDIKVHIPLPNAEERKGIFKKLLATKCKKFEISDKSVDEIGNNSEGWCGADL